MELFDPALRRKAQVVAANKIDVPEARERARELAKKLKRRKIPVHLISGATGEGLEELLDAMVGALDTAGLPQPLERDLHPEPPAEPGRGRQDQREDEREIDRREKAERAPPEGRRAKERATRARRK